MAWKADWWLMCDACKDGNFEWMDGESITNAIPYAVSLGWEFDDNRHDDRKKAICPKCIAQRNNNAKSNHSR